MNSAITRFYPFLFIKKTKKKELKVEFTLETELG
jgi:hypothetical protein